jgi:hypothetical protein
MMEYGWGGRAIDPKTWQAHECTQGPSLWGHERNHMSPEMQAQARVMRRKAAEDGERRPVQVLPGNYEVMDGACPWWDSMRAAAE